MGTSNLLLAFDLIGIFVFAIAGALAAVEKDLDVFGLVVIAGVSAIGGGLIRDLLLGFTPPAAFRDSRYLITPAIAAVLVFYLHRHVHRLRVVLMVLDAAGLALFTAAGVCLGLDHAALGKAHGLIACHDKMIQHAHVN